MKRSAPKRSTKPIRKVSLKKQKKDRELAAVRKKLLQDGEGCILRHYHNCSGGLEIDHIVPRSQGGGHEPHNLQTLCHFHHIVFKHGEPLLAKAIGLYGRPAEVLLRESFEYPSQWHMLVDRAERWLYDHA